MATPMKPSDQIRRLTPARHCFDVMQENEELIAKSLNATLSP